MRKIGILLAGVSLVFIMLSGHANAQYYSPNNDAYGYPGCGYDQWGNLAYCGYTNPDYGFYGYYGHYPYSYRYYPYGYRRHGWGGHWDRDRSRDRDWNGRYRR
jgi:hypothetical protein